MATASGLVGGGKEVPPTHRHNYIKKGDDVHRPRQTGRRIHGAIGRYTSMCASMAPYVNGYYQTVETGHSVYPDEPTWAGWLDYTHSH